MSTLRISNIEAKANVASASIDEKLRFTNSVGDVLVYLDGKTSGITTVGINTTSQTIRFDQNNNLDITGIITATKFSGPFDGTTGTFSGAISAASASFTGDVSIGGTLTYQDVTNVDAVGIVTARAGIHIDDSITHIGDTNTKIRFPAADTITAETGGTERVRIGSAGQIGIAGANYGSSGQVLTSQGSGSAVAWSTVSSGPSLANGVDNRVITATGANALNGEANLTFDGTALLVNKTGGCNIKVNSGGSNVTSIWTTGGTNTSWGTTSNDFATLITNNTERFRITSGGKVNIGGDYTSTTSTLRVLGDSNAGSQTYLEKNSGSTNNTYHTALTISARSTGSAAANYGPAINFQHAFGASNYAGCLIASQSNADVNTANLVFYPRNYGYTEALRIAANGDVIIGSGGGWSYPKALNVQGASGSILSLYNADTTSYAANTNTSIELKLLTGNTGNTTGALEIRGFKENGTNGNNARGLSFYTGGNGGGNAERIRITSGGHVLIGGTDEGDAHSDSRTLILGNTSASEIGITLINSTSGSGKIRFSDGVSPFNRGTIEYNHSNDSLNFVAAGGNPGYRIESNQRSFFNVVNSYVAIDKNNTGVIMEFIKSGNQVGNIGINNTSTTYNTSSDYRLKENIVDLTGAITRLKQLKPRRFNFKVDDSITVDGFIAHEVTSVPESITGTKDQVAIADDVTNGLAESVGDPLYQGIDQSKIVPLLTAALQEAITEIETLKTKVAALESS